MHWQQVTSAVIVSTLLSGPAAAMTGNQWLAEARSPVAIAYLDAVIRAEESFGLRGVYAAASARIHAGSTGKGPPGLPWHMFCPPEGATLQQAADIFAKYLTQNPAIRHRDAFRLARRSLIDAWPCKGNDDPPQSAVLWGIEKQIDD